MQHAEHAVIPFPADRTGIRRLAHQHAERGTPIQFGLFPSAVDQIAYENAYNEHARQLAQEHAE